MYQENIHALSTLYIKLPQNRALRSLVTVFRKNDMLQNQKEWEDCDAP